MKVPYNTEKSMEDWKAAKKVIEEFLKGSSIGETPAQRDHNSSALISRLCGANPVLFIVRSECVNWPDE